MNGPLGDYCSTGKMRGMAVLRSHGGRYQAVQDGEVHIDIAVIAAPTADPFGNANGVDGPSACGLLGFALADSEYADRVIVVTDNLIAFPCIPWQIQGNNVDFVVVMDRIGDPEKIVSGTTRITRSPDRQLIAELTARFVRDTGIMQEGFSFQAGAGGTALSFSIYLAEMMRDAGIEETADRILMVFLEDAPQRLADLDAAVERAHTPDVRMAAHAFKSAAATIRAEGLTSLLHRVEKAAEADDLASITELVPDVRAEVESVLAFLGPLRSD